MNEKVSCRASSNAWQIIITIVVSLFLLSSSAGATPRLVLQKSVAVDGIVDGEVHEGSVLVSTFTVKNDPEEPDADPANDTVNGVVITDVRNYPVLPKPPGGSNETISVGDLTKGQEESRQSSYTVTGDDVCALIFSPGGPVNKAIAMGTNSSGADVVSNEVEKTVLVNVKASMRMQVSSIPSKYARSGEAVTFSYLVENPATSTVGVHKLVVDDHFASNIVMNKTDLKPGETATGTATITVPSGAKTLSNLVEATATSCVGTSSASAENIITIIHPDMAIKMMGPNSSGRLDEIMTFNITVSNTGDSILDNVIVVDTLPKGLSYSDRGSTPKPIVAINPDGTSMLTYAPVNILSGNNHNIVLKARVNGEKNGTLANIAIVNAVDLAGSTLPEKTATKEVTAK